MHGVCESTKAVGVDRTEAAVVKKSDKSYYTSSTTEDITKQDKMQARGALEDAKDANGFSVYKCSIYRSSDETDSQTDKMKVGIRYKLNAGVKMYNKGQTSAAPLQTSIEGEPKEYMLFDSGVTLAAMASATAALALLNF